jgi:hypothetical protein
MLPGQYVTLPDGRHGQVLRILSQPVTGPRGVTTPGTLYELAVDGQLVYAGPIPASRPGWMTDAEYAAAVAQAPRLAPVGAEEER